jgi:hypothetical protein
MNITTLITFFVFSVVVVGCFLFFNVYNNNNNNTVEFVNLQEVASDNVQMLPGFVSRKLKIHSGEGFNSWFRLIMSQDVESDQDEEVVVESYQDEEVVVESDQDEEVAVESDEGVEEVAVESDQDEEVAVESDEGVEDLDAVSFELTPGIYNLSGYSIIVNSPSPESGIVDQYKDVNNTRSLPAYACIRNMDTNDVKYAGSITNTAFNLPSILNFTLQVNVTSVYQLQHQAGQDVGGLYLQIHADNTSPAALSSNHIFAALSIVKLE